MTSLEQPRSDIRFHVPRRVPDTEERAHRFVSERPEPFGSGSNPAFHRPGALHDALCSGARALQRVHPDERFLDASESSLDTPKRSNEAIVLRTEGHAQPKKIHTH